MVSANRTFAANMDTVPQIMDFVRGLCGGLPEQTAFDAAVVCEEVVVNIASYAYPDGEGGLTLRWNDDADSRTLTVTFEDAGIPFNPLLREDPDLNVPFEERKIGGLGIMMVRKLSNDVRYAYAGGKNLLTVTKRY